MDSGVQVGYSKLVHIVGFIVEIQDESCKKYRNGIMYIYM
jgi:hypothetical protein